MYEEEMNTLVNTKRVIKRKVPQDYNPHQVDRGGGNGVKKKKGKLLQQSVETDNGCDDCGATHFTKGNTQIKKWRHVFDEESKRNLKLCNACGLKLKRKQTKKEAPTKLLVDTDKDKYLEEGRAFGVNIARLIDDVSAKQFFCPKFRGKPCRCLQTFMQSNMNDITEVKKRANLLLRYHKKAKELMDPGTQESNSSLKRSKEYDHFVLTNRDYLKSQLRLCELAVQKVLGYSNNFLYKQNRTEGKRLTIKPTIGAEKSSINVEDIPESHEEVCKDVSCTAQARAIPCPDLVRLRDKAREGQADRKAAIEELLERWSVCGCFIQLVTGAGISLITRLARQGRNQGDKETEDNQ